VTDTQLYIAIGLPVIAVLTSLVISLIQISGIREDMREFRREFNELRREVNTKIDLLTGQVCELMSK